MSIEAEYGSNKECCGAQRALNNTKSHKKTGLVLNFLATCMASNAAGYEHGDVQADGEMEGENIHSGTFSRKVTLARKFLIKTPPLVHNKAAGLAL